VLLVQKGESSTLGKVIDVPPAKDIRRALFGNVTFLPGSVLVRRSTMLAINGFNPRLRHGNEDYELWLRLLHAGAKFAACRAPLLQYRRHERNTSKNRAWFDECMGIYRRLVLPHLPRFSGWITYFRFLSEHEVDLAYTLRQQEDSEHLATMARSILHWPFDDFYRYKVLIHMLYLRLRK